jgi:hypothetical protein
MVKSERTERRMTTAAAARTTRGGDVGQLLERLEKHAKARNMLPEAAVLVYRIGTTRQPHAIDVYVGGKQVTMWEQYDFLPKFPPGIRKIDVELVLTSIVRLLDIASAAERRQRDGTMGAGLTPNPQSP